MTLFKILAAITLITLNVSCIEEYKQEECYNIIKQDSELIYTGRYFMRVYYVICDNGKRYRCVDGRISKYNGVEIFCTKY